MFREFYTHHLLQLSRRRQARRLADSAVQNVGEQKERTQSIIGYEIDEHGQVIPDAPFTVTPRQRMKHAMVLGGPGSGKSVLLRRLTLAVAGCEGENVIVQDPRNSDLTEMLLQHLLAIAPPEHWVGRVGLVDLMASRISSHNPLYVAPGVDPHLVAGDFTGPVIEMADSPGVRWIELFQFTVQALCLSGEHVCPMDIAVFLADSAYRHRILSTVRDPFVLRYFRHTFDILKESEQAAWASSVNNKVSPLIQNPVLRRLYRPEQPFDFSPFFDRSPGKILLLSLRLNAVPKEAALLASRTILRQILGCAFARENIAEHLRRPTHILLDEISHLVGDEQWERAIVETRKYYTGITGAGQSLSQIPTMERRRTLISSVQYLFCGRMGASDAMDMVRETGCDDVAAMKKRLMHLAPGEMLVLERGKEPKFIQVVKDPDPAVDPAAVAALKEIAMDTMGARPTADIDREIEERYAVDRFDRSDDEPVLEVRSAPSNRSHRHPEGDNDETY